MSPLRLGIFLSPQLSLLPSDTTHLHPLSTMDIHYPGVMTIPPHPLASTSTSHPPVSHPFTTFYDSPLSVYKSKSQDEATEYEIRVITISYFIAVDLRYMFGTGLACFFFGVL